MKVLGAKVPDIQYGDILDYKSSCQNLGEIYYPLFHLHHKNMRNIVFHCAIAPSGPSSSHYRGFTITLRHTTLSGTPLGERSARCADFYLTQQTTFTAETHVPGGIRTPKPSKRAAVGQRLRRRGPWHRRRRQCRSPKSKVI